MIMFGLSHAYGQKFDHTSHDFGDVSYWKNSTAVFTCTNNTKETIVFLPTFPKPDLQVEIEPKELKPGETGKVMITYYTRDRGNFKKQVSIFTNNSAKPINLTVSGNIVDFAPDAILECPTINHDNDDKKGYVQEFQVIEAGSGEIIEGAYFTLTAGSKRILDDKTNDKGMVSVKNLDGNYTIAVWKQGYESVTIPTHVGKYRGRIMIELQPVVEEEPVVASTTVNNPPNDPPPPTVTEVEEEPTVVAVTPTPTPVPQPEPDPQPDPQPDPTPVDKGSTQTNTTTTVTVVTTTTTRSVDGEVVSVDTIVSRKEDTQTNTTNTTVVDNASTQPPVVETQPVVTPPPPKVPVETEDVPRVRVDNTVVQLYQVVEKGTGRPIENAKLVVTKYNEVVTQSNTDDNGVTSSEVLSGQYRIVVSKQGYETENMSRYLSSSRGTVIIELEPLVKPEPPVVASTPEPPVVQPDPPVVVDEPEPVTEPDVTNNASTQPPVVETVPVVTEQPPVIEPVDVDPTLNVNLYSPNNVVFLIDASQSMNKPDKLPLLKKSMRELIEVLRDVDKVTIIAYNREPWVVLPTTSVTDKEAILAQIDSLTGKDWTNGVKGLEYAYDLIKENFIVGGNNQIILSTDGLFNSPNSDETDGLYKFVRREAMDTGIILSVIGFGDEPGARRLMKKLAVNGQGNFIQFDQLGAAQALIDEIKAQSAVQ